MKNQWKTQRLKFSGVWISTAKWRMKMLISQHHMMQNKTKWHESDAARSPVKINWTVFFSVKQRQISSTSLISALKDQSHYLWSFIMCFNIFPHYSAERRDVCELLKTFLIVTLLIICMLMWSHMWSMQLYQSSQIKFSFAGL